LVQDHHEVDQRGFTHRTSASAYWNANRRLLGLPPIDIASEERQSSHSSAPHGLADDGIPGNKTLARFERAGMVAA
jgi:hypothetical protein